jgi:hypothetical protein
MQSYIAYQIEHRVTPVVLFPSVPNCTRFTPFAPQGRHEPPYVAFTGAQGSSDFCSPNLRPQRCKRLIMVVRSLLPLHMAVRSPCCPLPGGKKVLPVLCIHAVTPHLHHICTRLFKNSMKIIYPVYEFQSKGVNLLKISFSKQFG